MSSCARVEPHGDFRRAADLISERTGSPGVFDPEDDGAAEERIDQLLSDGLAVDEAVQLALLNNPEFQALFFEIGASRADVVQSTLLTNPTFALGLQFPEGGGLTDLTLSFAQQIADLWQIPVRKRMAEAELEQAILRVGQKAVELAAEIRAECYRVLALRRAVEFADENVRLADRVGRIAQAQFDAGEVSELDVNLTRSTQVDMQQDLIVVRGELRLAEAALSRLLGVIQREQEWQLVDELPTSWTHLEDEADLVERALENRFDARVALLQAQQAEEALRLECRRVFSDVQIGAAFERGEQRALPGRKIAADTARASAAAGTLTAPDIQTPGQRALEKSQIIDAKLGPTLALTLPVWDQNQAQIAKARTRALQTRRQYEAVLDAISAEVRSAAISLRVADESMRLQQEVGLPRAESVLSGAEHRYQAGEQSVLIVTEAQEALTTRRRAFVSALRDRAMWQARLEGVLGGRDGPDGEMKP